MLRQRPAAPATIAKPQPPQRSRSAAVQKTPPRARGRAQRDLDRLLGRIETLTDEIRRLEGELADPDLFGRDRAAFAARTERLAGTRAELEAAEQRWLELASHHEQVI
jgi:ATP-binding cassette subfamily F protein uup